MIRRAVPGIASLAILLLSASSAQAGCDDCRYIDRGDRMEGSDDPQVSSGDVTLLAVHYQPPSGPVKTATGRLHLWFWLPGTETPRITVREESKHYRMDPKPKTFPAGLQELTWSRDVVARLDLDPATFSAKVSDRDEQVFYPAFLSEGARPAGGGTYLFLLHSGAGLEGTCQIVRDAPEGALTVRDLACAREFGGLISLPWDGRDSRGQPVPPGLYKLRIRGEMLSETPRPVRKAISFVHYGRLD